MAELRGDGKQNKCQQWSKFNNIPKNIQKLIEDMTNDEPTQRPNAAEVHQRCLDILHEQGVLTNKFI
jgi:hypothetical protein